MEALDCEYIFRVTSDGVQDASGDADVRFVSTGEKIVRCRDCIYFDTFLSDMGGSGSCDRNVDYWDEAGEGFSVSKNDYCSFGQTKEGD